MIPFIEGDGLPRKRISEPVRWGVSFGSIRTERKPAVIFRIAINKEDVHTRLFQLLHAAFDQS